MFQSNLYPSGAEILPVSGFETHAPSERERERLKNHPPFSAFRCKARFGVPNNS